MLMLRKRCSSKRLKRKRQLEFRGGKEERALLIQINPGILLQYVVQYMQ
jgi:hypothetical protein